MQQTMPKSDAKIVPKARQNNPKHTPELPQNDAKFFPQSSQNRPKMKREIIFQNNSDWQGF